MRTNLALAKRRAVAPIIATLLLIAIVAVGAAVIFAFAQGVFNTQQSTSLPVMESVSIFGFDTRDSTNHNSHTGSSLTAKGSSGTIGDGIITAADVVHIYLHNGGLDNVSILNVTFAGSTYTFDSATGSTPAAKGKWFLVNSGATSGSGTQQINSGQDVTLALNVTDTQKVGRSALLKIITSGGTVLADKIELGQKVG